MPAFFGTTATNATSAAINIPTKIVSFSLANRTGGNIDVSIGVIFGSTFYFLFNHTLAAKAEYVYVGGEILIETNNQIYIAATGACDYYVTIKPD